MSADGEWKIVSKKKGMKKRRGDVKERNIAQGVENLSVSEGGRIQRKIRETIEELRSSEFWSVCRETVQKVTNKYRTAPLATSSGLGVGVAEFLEYKHDDLDHCQTTLEFVCYGIGSFSTSVSSRYQLALLFLLLETLQLIYFYSTANVYCPGTIRVDEVHIPRFSCLLFDPLFTEWEKRFLKDCGLVVIKENEEGKRHVDRPTLFYMIHCGKALYNNLLWKNWSPQQLAQTTLIGNSFKGIEERLPARVLQRDYTYINYILAVTEETAFPYSERYMDIFNDTSIHQFPRRKLDSKPKEFWEGAAEPTYQQCEDLEIIRNG